MVHNLAFHNISGGAFPVPAFANGSIRQEGALVGVARWVNWAFVPRMATEIHNGYQSCPRRHVCAISSEVGPNRSNFFYG